MFDITIKNILANIWPMLVIITVILSSLRVVYIIRNKETFVLYREILKLGFVIYIMSLFYVVTFQDVSWSSSNFIPFKEMLRYRIFSNLFFKNVVGNMIMFLPYGFFTSYFLKLDRKKAIIYLSLLVSCTIEFTQLLIGRVFDVDDIILNVLGGLFGYFIYRFVYFVRDHLPKVLKNNIFYNIIVVIILSCIFYYIYTVLGAN